MLVLCLCAACGRTPEAEPGVHDCSNLACRPTTTVSWTGQYGVAPLDFLLVVDDSVPGGPAQAALSKAMRAIADNIYWLLLETRFAMDIHVAVVPANLVDNGTTGLWPESQACAVVDGSYLRTSPLCGTAPNFAGSLADLLDCAGAHVLGSGQPRRPMETVRALLSPGGLGQTTGFRRPAAQLLLGIVSATDDPDLATGAGRADYRDFVLGAVSDPDALWLAIAAPADAQGLRGFASFFDYSATFDDLAADSWYYLSSLGEPLSAKVQFLCIDYPIVDLTAPGSPIAPMCIVVERDTSPDGTSQETALPMCPAASTEDAPCWRLVLDNNKCPVNGQRIDIVRPGCRSPDRLKYRVTCAVEYEQVPSSELLGVPGNCGTADDPATLVVTDRVPALGATVKNVDITEGFTVAFASSFTPTIMIDESSPLHTASYETQSSREWNPSISGKAGRFERIVGSWGVAPAHVELAAVAGYRTDDGCHYKLPSPLLSYDVTP
jgi:hypothetical protein